MSSHQSLSLSPNFIPDSAVLFFASTVTGLFLVYRAKVQRLKIESKEKGSTLGSGGSRAPYQPPPKDIRQTSPAPSIKVVGSVGDQSLHGEVLEG
jgi:hypothetical protein